MHVCMADINIEKYRDFEVVSLPRVLVDSSAGLSPKVQTVALSISGFLTTGLRLVVHMEEIKNTGGDWKSGSDLGSTTWAGSTYHELQYSNDLPQSQGIKFQ